ncbi:MAG: hypothetical protein Q9M20_04960 [Mariprofundaceae bacterium]|nr:hypothetical protein [Mariprofundaceae bacterium]
MNEFRKTLTPVYHGIAMGLLALIFGALWAAYLATHHESLHGSFEAAESKMKQVQMQADMSMTDMNVKSLAHDHAAGTSASHDHADAMSNSSGHSEQHMHGGEHEAGAQHSHSGSLATDSMRRLLRGHIHFMGIGLLVMILLIFVASTNLKDTWKKVFGWTFGLGALMYPPAWILMGFRTVEFGPQGAEASVMWLFGPAVGLLIGSLIAFFAVMAIEYTGLNKTALFSWAFNQQTSQ